MIEGNIYSAVPGSFKKEFFEVLIEQGNLKIERIVSGGHCSPETGWYDQDKNEWVLLLKGSAELTFVDNVTIHLKSGDYLHIPAHKKHKVSWTDPNQESIWLAVHY